jgi:hypothetical protein
MIMVSSDADLLSIATTWQQESKFFCGLVYIHPQRVSIGRSVLDLELIAKASLPGEFENRITYLPLG